MNPVFVMFNLPEGMTEQDLMTLLRDSLDDFKTVRCNGDAHQYARFVVAKGYNKPLSEVDAAAAVARKEQQVQQRFDWAYQLKSNTHHMRKLHESEAEAALSAIDKLVNGE